MISLTKKQTEAFRAATSGKYQAVIFGGAIRGGKSYALLITFFYLALNFNKSRWVIIRKSLPDLKRNTFPTVNSILDMGVREKIQKWNHDTQVITMANGSEIMFMSESYEEDKDLNRFKGLEANGFGFDEINECQESTFYKAIERTGTWLQSEGNPPMVIFATLNPAQNWTKKLFYEPFINGTINPKWLFIPSKITDNPHIPEAYRENLKSLSPTEYARFVEGDWDAIESVDNPWLHSWDDKYIDANIEMNINLPYIVSIDFNLNPFCGIIAQIQGQTLCILDEFSIENGSIPKLADLLKTLPRKELMRMTGDAMGNRGSIEQRDHSTSYQQIQKLIGLRDAQFTIGANPRHDNSRVECNTLVRKGLVKIHPSCKSTIFDFNQVASDEHGKIKKKNRGQTNQRADHLDAFRYICSNFMRKYL